MGVGGKGEEAEEFKNIKLSLCKNLREERERGKGE